jgi:hypothetical protein
MIHLDVEKGVDGNHLLTHGVRPFKDLRTYVLQEGVGRPAAEDHDFGGRDSIYEERHGRARADRFVADLVGVKAKSGFAPECVHLRRANEGAYVQRMVKTSFARVSTLSLTYRVTPNRMCRTYPTPCSHMVTPFCTGSTPCNIQPGEIILALTS